jgi:hypothetical protein
LQQSLMSTGTLVLAGAAASALKLKVAIFSKRLQLPHGAEMASAEAELGLDAVGPTVRRRAP